jgi:hypothetical protein
LFKTFWGHEGDVSDAIQLGKAAQFDGIEAPAPIDPAERAAFFSEIESAGMQWIAEVSTCTPSGFYVPTKGCSVSEHLDSLEKGVKRSLEGAPLFINSMAGYDAWSAAEALEFHQGVVRLQDKYETIISVETHRGRPPTARG